MNASTQNLVGLERIIEDLRKRLHAAAASSSFLDSEVYQLSVKLDLAIVQYYDQMLLIKS
ncbi:aspartyl-phosphate phosphatase Spo0E family protein [Paenibacillus hexagrammi]|uniref:Aspartyl-phosphate phosphatase Spo0E family protein n=1 Tax=Paenibacillus hexagrammi TaxID=2908839 RepID=A0ABY3SNR0_9BACL|nr:aspartyl-phosphate phosphatase Spo0E family protein [Paenibacillus sp. YPD9-1]UJF35070.1 aspartyl-phosphate phosphatase Spo0E family protein [Paenibacillus sp. YPD9-1]